MSKRWLPRLDHVAIAIAMASMAACGSSGSDASTATDASSDVASACGLAPSIDCFTGAVGRACVDVGQPPACGDAGWACPSGTVELSQCGCAAGPTRPGELPKQPGDACDPPRDAGTGDARADADADADARADADAP